MSDHEVPFTRFDLLMVLSGEMPRGHIYELFKKAAAGSLTAVEVRTGLVFDPGSFLSLAARHGGSGIQLRVPSYLNEALNLAKDDEEATRTGPVVLFRGIRLHPWKREFIMVTVDYDRLMEAGRREGIDAAEPVAPYPVTPTPEGHECHPHPGGASLASMASGTIVARV